MFELTNQQRKFFGLDPIEKGWERVVFDGDPYRPQSILYYDGNTIKRHIISTGKKYKEVHYNELTKDRCILLPKAKGKEKKLTASVLEKRQPSGVYLNINDGYMAIGSFATATIFYSSVMEPDLKIKDSIAEQVSEFIKNMPANHLNEITQFKNAKRKNIKFKVGDYFCFKLNVKEYAFGRILLDVGKIRKKKLIPKDHGLNLLMGLPVIIQLFVYKSETKDVELSLLDKQPLMPSDVMMDNLLLHGEYEIIGHKKLNEEDFEFPISYGADISYDNQKTVFLQWGLIHKELPQSTFNKYTSGGLYGRNPHGYYAIGMTPFYLYDLKKAIENGIYDFENSTLIFAENDLRNPKNKKNKKEIFKAFGLDVNKSYTENCLLTGTMKINELLALMHDNK